MNSNQNRNCFVLFITIGMFLTCTANLVYGQINYKSNDVVTFSDFRWVYCVDFSPTEVYFATENGVWYMDRFNGKPIGPYSVNGNLQAVSTRRGRLILHHGNSRTLWLWTLNGLKYHRWDRNFWEEVTNFHPDEVVALGETPENIIVDTGQNPDRYVILSAFSAIVQRVADDPPPDVRWVYFSENHEFPFYRLANDRNWWYNEADGSIRDERRKLYKPVFDLLDEQYNRRYICYPGLGIGITDESHLSLEIMQPGISGKDVRAFSFFGGDFIWAGGNNGEKDGISLFDRRTGLWRQFDAGWIFGIESHRVRDVVRAGSVIYFATESGLTWFKPAGGQWKTVHRLDGLVDDDVRALAVTSKYIFAGSEYGVSRMSLPNGSLSREDDARLENFAAADMVSAGDTVWAAGLTGVFRWQPDEWIRISAADRWSGDEAANCLAILPKYLLIGEKQGVNELNRSTGEFEMYSANAYLRNEPVFSVAGNDSLIWVGTDRGLTAIHRHKRSTLTYGRIQGVPEMPIYQITVEADTLWLASHAGLTRFIWNRPVRDIF